ncbi:hypothetical protein GARC_4851 [Paraglaciecola arctica BSs20135]|uniref:Uncharacterized protein n=1 Tax=Paraglaciecola arctica BSs20135 TaxID=493475 RepID=K6YYI7_9ALTE|nr:hypothetical protein [Paraglaciecola arctica]GAC21788.1 hypothetical protein GARC_4851 [Paraglaciecola arctica BSs20135]
MAGISYVSAETQDSLQFSGFARVVLGYIDENDATYLSYDLRAIALPPESQTRVLFNTKMVGLTESRIQSCWAQMRFSGRKKPPTELTNETLVNSVFTKPPRYYC